MQPSTRHRPLLGFTMMELVVTFLILAILSLIAIPTYQAVFTQSASSVSTDQLVTIANNASALAVAAGEPAPSYGDYAAAASGLSTTDGGSNHLTLSSPPGSDSTKYGTVAVAIDNPGTSSQVVGLAMPGTTSGFVAYAQVPTPGPGATVVSWTCPTTSGTTTASAQIALTGHSTCSSGTGTTTAGGGGGTNTTLTGYDNAIELDTPVGHWPLADSSGTTAADLASPATNGTYTGSPTLNQTGPAPGITTAMSTATAGYATIANDTSAATFAAGFSAELWFKATSSGVLAYATNSAETTSYPILWINPTTNTLSANASTTGSAATTSYPVTTGAWYYAVVTATSSGTNLYLNGSQVASTANPLNITNQPRWYVGTGTMPASPSTFLHSSNTLLAQFALYAKALTQEEIAAHYTASGMTSYADTVNQYNPAAYWPLNEVSPTGTPPVAADASGNNHNGNYGTGLFSPTPAAGAAPFAAAGSPLLGQTTPTFPNPLPGPQSAYSLQLWVKIPTCTSTCAMTLVSDGSNPDITLTPSGQVATPLGNLSSGAPIEDGNWHFIVLTYSANPAVTALYLDGTLLGVGQPASAQSLATTWKINPSPVAYAANLSATNFGIYPTALSATQVRNLYPLNPPADAYAAQVLANNPQGFWRLGDVADYPSADDGSGYNQTGSFGCSEASCSPILGVPSHSNFTAATYFDGSTKVTTPVTLSNTTTETFQAWVKLASSSGTAEYIIDSRPVGSQKGLVLSADGTAGSTQTPYPGQIVFQAVSSGSAIGIATQGPSLADGSWHFVTAVFSAPTGAIVTPSSFTLYVDGVSVPTQQFTHATSSQMTSGFTTTSGMVLGAGFAGGLSDVAIYTSALTPSAVTAQCAANGPAC